MLKIRAGCHYIGRYFVIVDRDFPPTYQLDIPEGKVLGSKFARFGCLAFIFWKHERADRKQRIVKQPAFWSKKFNCQGPEK